MLGRFVVRGGVRRLHTSAASLQTGNVRGVVFNGPNAPFEQLTVPFSSVEEKLGGRALVRVDLATICGSDLHTIAGHRTEPTPLILGHEAVGTVVATGHSSRLTAGQRISWTIGDSCGQCFPCSTLHLPNKCQRIFKYGHADITDGSGLNGCYATHIELRPGTHTVEVPAELSDAVAAPANCALATVVNALDPATTGSQAGCSAIVQGAGLLGLYACALLSSRGVRPVFCFDSNVHRLEAAAAFGAVPVDVSATTADARRAMVLPQTRSQIGVDICLEVCGQSEALLEGIDLLRVGGFYSWAGMVHPRTDLGGITAEKILRKCLTVRGVHNYAPRHLDTAFDFLKHHNDVFPFASLVSPPFGLSDFPAALEEAQRMKWPRVSIAPQLP